MAVVSEAFVKIRPKLDGFAAELRREVKKAVGTEGAKVRVSPDLTGFKAKLAAEVKKAEGLGVKVKVEPDLTGFKTKLNAEIKARNITAKVKVEPDLTGFGTSLRRGLADLRNDVRGAGDSLGRQFGEGFNNGSRNTIDGNGAGTGNLGNNNVLGNQTRDSNRFNNSLRQSLQGVQQLGRGLTRIGLVNSLVVVAGQAVVLAAALAPIAGILAAIPGAIAVAGASIGTLLTGFSGIGTALSATSKATAGAVSNTRAQQRAVENAIKDVARAQRDLVSANKDVVRAQDDIADAVRGVDDAYSNAIDTLRESQQAQDRVTKSLAALNKARVDAKRALDDYKDSLRSAALDEESANLALIDAQEEYNKLIGDGVENEVKLRKARLAVEQAELRQSEAVERNIDLQKEAADAQAKGIDQADGVKEAQDALSQSYLDAEKAQKRVIDANYDVAKAQKAVQDAQDGVADANQRVLDAQEGIAEANQAVTDSQLALAEASAGGASALDKAAEAMAKLSPNARSLVLAIRALAPEFAALRRSVQDILLADVDTAFTNFARTSLPTLKKGLGETAAAFNELILKSLGVASSPLFQGNMTLIFEGTARVIRSFGDALPDLILGLSNLAVAALPVIERFTTFVTEGLKAFGVTLQTKEGVDKYTTSMNKAADTLSTLYDILKNVGSIIGTVFTAADGAGFLENLKSITGEFDKFLKTPEGQEDLKTLFTALADSSKAMASVIGTVARGIIDILDAFQKLPEPVQSFLLKFFAWSIILGPVVANMASLAIGVAGLATALSGVGLIVGAVILGIGTFTAAIYFGITRFDDLVEASSQGWTQIREAGGQAVTFLTGRFESLKTELVERLGAIGTTGSQAFNGFKANALSNLDGIREGAEAKIPTIVSAFTSLPGKIVGAFGDAGQLLFNVGQNIVIGLINGLGKQFDNLTKAFENLANKGKDTFKRILGIASPSKVFAGFGVNLVEGLVQGIDDSRAKMIDKVMTRLTDDLVINPTLDASSVRGSVAIGTPGTSSEDNRRFVVNQYFTDSTPQTPEEALRKAQRLEPIMVAG